MKRQDDEMLFERLLEGEGDKALRPLMERYGDALTLYANGYVHDIHAAEDLMIESCFLLPGEIMAFNPYIAFNYVLTFATAALLACAWSSDAL